MKDFEVLRLNAGQNYALDCMHTRDRTIFLTGKAGTGKSTVLQLFKKLDVQNAVILAPTGVAAIQAGGQTIHSFFRLPPKMLNISELPRMARKFAESLELIIIDEISMVRADLLDHMHYILSKARKSRLPFGGVRCYFVGDLFQLPPVVTKEVEREHIESLYDSPYFFSSGVFQEIRDFEMIELHQVVRQRDRGFIRLLNRIREGTADDDDLQEINRCCEPFRKLDPGYISLTTTNRQSKLINTKKLALINADARIYQAEISGHVSPGSYPTQEILILKPGAQVMILRNDAQRRYANGSIGLVKELTKDRVLVDLTDPLEGESTEVWIEKEEWTSYRYSLDASEKGRIKTEIAGVFRQIPIRLAWAITIHKSQGQTFNKVCIDMGYGSFAHGQSYVALSRSSNIENLILRKPLRNSDILCDERVTDFYRRYQ